MSQQIILHEYLDGQISIRHGKTRLAFRPIEAPAPKAYQPVVSRFKVRGIELEAVKFLFEI